MKNIWSTHLKLFDFYESASNDDHHTTAGEDNDEGMDDEAEDHDQDILTHQGEGVPHDLNIVDGSELTKIFLKLLLLSLPWQTTHK